MKIRVGIVTAPKIDYEQREKTFVLKNVRIGIGFHWDRQEDEEFQGALDIIQIPNPVLPNGAPWKVAVNTIDLEDYLCAVISSEMNADSPMELLKAHAVISRSWAIRQIENARSSGRPVHNGFDLCADDHCQRYEGLRRTNRRAIEAVRDTEGQVLMYNGAICDCRYHKCCGGRTEIWRTCWENIDVPYIRSVECNYCNPSYIDRRSPADRTRLLRSCLNDYDRETADYHDWQVTYTEEELDAIVRDKSGIAFGHITELVPMHRGPSGRIDMLKIVGTEHTEIIGTEKIIPGVPGKELKIRLWLSRTCLYSSWFEIAHGDGCWTLTGHGWGHGAGLCQIGAATMAAEGFSYEDILRFYYPGTTIGRHE